MPVTATPTLFFVFNVDGRVNALDFNPLATFFGSGDLWQEGDFNYDGAVSTADFTLLAANFNQTTTISAAPLGSLVPEPAILPVIAILALRRRRSFKHA